MSRLISLALLVSLGAPPAFAQTAASPTSQTKAAAIAAAISEQWMQCQQNADRLSAENAGLHKTIEAMASHRPVTPPQKP